MRKNLLPMINLEELSIAELRQWFCQRLGTNQFWSLDKDFILINSCHLTVLQDDFYTMGDTMIICTNGHCLCELNGQELRLIPQTTLIVLNRQRMHYVEASEDFLFSVVVMSRSFSEQLQVGNQYRVLESARTIPIFTYREQDWRDFICYMQLIESALKMKDYPHRHHLGRLLFEAQHYALGQHLQQEDSVGSRKDDICLRFNRLLTLEYRRHHTVSFYAERLSVTPKHLSECVKKNSGATAGDWIDRMLIRDAKQMLGNTQLSILEISQVLGFEDPSAFGKYFKRIMGVSPKNYRDTNVAQ